MTDPRPQESSGCSQALAILFMLGWLLLVPFGGALLINLALDDPARASSVVLTLFTGGVLAAPYVAIALFTRRRSGWEKVNALAAGFTAVAGYVALDALLRAFLPGEPNLLAALRLLLFPPYLWLAARFVPRLADHELEHSVAEWLGLVGNRASTLWLALALAALCTLPWPLTGALGDVIQTLAFLLQGSAAILPPLFLFWGLLFRLWTERLARSWLAALLVILTYGLFIAAQVLPGGAWGALPQGLVLPLLALLLTELRARGRSVWPLVPLALLVLVVPRLFTDPRDVALQGIPEIQHIIAYGVTWVLVALAGLSLWLLRTFAPQIFGPEQEGHRIWSYVALAAAALLWLGWLLLYVTLGNPGFYNDGFLIIMEEQADLDAAYEIEVREERLQYVYDTLRTTAQESQAPVREALDDAGLPYRPYYLMNMIRVDGYRWRMGAYEELPGVDRVILNPNVREYPNRIPISGVTGEGALGTTIDGLVPNLQAINAPAAWDLGVTGAGIVVGGQDTGYDWSHPALQPHYRGWDGSTATHDYNWHDAWADSEVPFDDGEHGTHTLGTVLGNDPDGRRVGVAPDAVWIGCRNMRRGLGNPGAYAACSEFFLAPYPLGGDPFTDGDIIRAAHVVNNSWGCPPEEGCHAETLEPAMDALRAAGIMMVVSAGNDGPTCGTAATPPANYDSVFSVGATNNQGLIVGFSSRGPVEDGIKPDVSAPGFNILSSTPGGDYGYASGTSMAGPHVAGLVALLWSAEPDLIGDIAATEALICETADAQAVEESCPAELTGVEELVASVEEGGGCACGGVTGVPNNVYGCGVLDAGAAVEAALAR
ncbi:MAG: S8 family serine peptidase [Anaerolineales bacterium]